MTLYQQGLKQVLAGNTSIEETACLSYTSLNADDPIEDDELPPSDNGIKALPSPPPREPD